MKIMKFTTILTILCIVMIIPINVDLSINTGIITAQAATTDFVSLWDTTKTSIGSSTMYQIKLPLEEDGSYDFTVYWGDGSSSDIDTYYTVDTTHTYTIEDVIASEGVFTIIISGSLSATAENSS